MKKKNHTPKKKKVVSMETQSHITRNIDGVGEIK